MSIAQLIEGRGAVLTCEAGSSIRQAIAILADKRIGALPVVKDGAVIGIFSERDALYNLHQHGPDMLDLRVDDAMTSPAVTVDPEADVLAALALMTRRRVRHLPVMKNGAMIGFVSIGDLVKHRIDRIESEAEALRTYIQTA